MVLTVGSGQARVALVADGNANTQIGQCVPSIAMEFLADNPCDRLGPVLGLPPHLVQQPSRDVPAAITTVQASGFGCITGPSGAGKTEIPVRSRAMGASP